MTTTKTSTHKFFEQACDQSKGLATFDEIQALLADTIVTTAKIETCPLEEAGNKILAQDIIAPRNIPAFDNAAVDGYAFAHGDLAGNNYQLEVVEEIFAGQSDIAPLAPGTAARIFTGAVMPENADTCLMQENARLEATTLIVPDVIKAGANARAAGEDQKKGNVVVPARTRLRPPELGAIASTGIDQVKVRTPLKVALLSTGDEVIRPGNRLKEGQIYDSNFHLLNGLAKAADITLDDIGVLADDETTIFDTIKRLSQSHDVILSTGGASVGDKDFIIAAMQKLGILHSWKIAIKPGRPLAIGQIGKAVFLGLPGNPVAAFNTWVLFGLPMFAYLQGANWTPPQRFPVPAGFSLPNKKTGRREFLRGWIENTESGPIVRKFHRDGSGLISGLTAATGLIEIAEEVSGVETGTTVDFIPFAQFGIKS
jgi:molybdopterin molybdotransferase